MAILRFGGKRAPERIDAAPLSPSRALTSPSANQAEAKPGATSAACA